MRSVQRDRRAALAAFHDTYDLRRAIWQEHRPKLKESREREAIRLQQRDAVSSSLAELLVTTSTPESDSRGVRHG